MSDIKIDASMVLQVVQLGLGAIKQWRASTGRPIEDDVTAESIAEMPTHDFTAAVEEGEGG